MKQNTLSRKSTKAVTADRVKVCDVQKAQANNSRPKNRRDFQFEIISPQNAAKRTKQRV